MNRRVLAVIPARAGSKGIPNKNIRLVNNKPLIYYCMKNAIEAELVTDVIVSTDSPEVEVIARQMGIRTVARSRELCGDAVTLDAVIYDAIPKDEEFDYIVTMQPTSPTLKSTTLNEAIRYAIEKELDTVISVINQPHLSWREEQGQKVPNYKERLNRQYLPAQYNETGAFVISRAEVVTPDTRIGRRMDVFEVSEEEAIDIDTFADLQYAETVMKKRKIAIYVNGNNAWGMGHIYRALELADEFFSKPDIYFDVNQTDIRSFGTTTHALIGVDGVTELLEKLRENQYDILINDVLSTSTDYMNAVREALPHGRIVNFEDDGEGMHQADLVINALYQNSDLPNEKTGEDYYISSKLFMFYEPIEIREKVEKVFISFGGADPRNYSDRLLKIISTDKYKNKDFVVVLGRAKQNVEELLEYNEYDNIEVLYDVRNMPEIMASCDVAVTSRGRTGYELALLGIPTIAMAQNAREEKHVFVSNENGFSYIGLNPSDHIMEATLDMYLELSREERLAFQRKLLQHDLRNGRRRVMNLISLL